MTQHDQILNHLKEHGSITTLDAIKDYWCTRLSQYILILKREGYVITPVWETNGTKRWVRYYLTTTGADANI